MKKLILKWLGIDMLKTKISELEKTNKELKSVIMVGVDFHPKLPASWAVICIDGKPDYVRFVNLPTREIREIAQFLKKYDRNNCVVDLPYGMPKDLFFI